MSDSAPVQAPARHQVDAVKECSGGPEPDKYNFNPYSQEMFTSFQLLQGNPVVTEVPVAPMNAFHGLQSAQKQFIAGGRCANDARNEQGTFAALPDHPDSSDSAQPRLDTRRILPPSAAPATRNSFRSTEDSRAVKRKLEALEDTKDGPALPVQPQFVSCSPSIQVPMAVPIPLVNDSFNVVGGQNYRLLSHNQAVAVPFAPASASFEGVKAEPQPVVGHVGSLEQNVPVLAQSLVGFAPMTILPEPQNAFAAPAAAANATNDGETARTETDTSNNTANASSTPPKRRKRKNRLCAEKGCVKNARGRTPFCVRHGGGARCSVEGCEKGARPHSLYCSGHGGGHRCLFSGCNKGALAKSVYCRRHGKLGQARKLL